MNQPLPLARLLALSLGALQVGCTHMGPKTVAVDRFDYGSAIADSWKQQTLLNIVKLRYTDLPVFVDVASIVAGYSLETGLTAGGSFPETTSFGGNTATVGGSAKFTDRPTITYIPMTGEKFLRGLITPIDPKHIFFLLQSGYPADFILGLTVESLNGVRNSSAATGATRAPDPDFVRALALLREVQAAGGVGMRVEEGMAKGQTAVVFFRQEDLPAEIQEKAAEVRRLLKLPGDGDRFTLSYSPVRGANDQLTVNSRSMLQIMSAFAGHVEIPEADLAAGRAMPGITTAAPPGVQSAVRIRSGPDKPAHAFTAVRYRNTWFWIEDDNWQTKRALTAVMFFFTLAETGGNDRMPLITIPAQ